MDSIPTGAIPVDQFEADVAPQAQAPAQPTQPTQVAHTPNDVPPGAIPVQEFEAQEDAYQGLGHTVKAGLEGVAKGVLGPLAPLAEQAYGIADKADIQGREEAHPIAQGVGQVVGLLSPIGQGPLLAKAGEAAASHLIPQATTYAARVGSSAVRAATEMAVLQGSDEVAKRILQDEPGSAESAIANVGLAAALGGVGGAFMTGAISPIWTATVGGKIESALQGLSSRLGGQELPSTASDLIARSGVEMPPEVAAKVNGSPWANRYDSKLSQTDSTMAGRSYQKTVNQYRAELGDEAIKTLGNDSNYIQQVGDVDKYGTGQKQIMTLHNELKQISEPITEAYGKVNKEFQNTNVSGSNHVQIRDDIAKLALEKGWNKASQEDAMNLVQSTLKKLPDQTTAKDLKNFITNLRDDNPFGTKTYHIARDLARTIEDGLGRTISEGVANSTEKSITPGAYDALKKQYSGLKRTFEALDEHLNVGKWDGPQTFLKALEKLGTTKGELALNRLSGTNRAQVLDILKEVAPETLSQVRQYHVDRLLKSAKEGDSINPSKLIRNLNNEKQFSPQIKNLIATPEAQSKLQAIGDITEKMKDPTHNWSNTARTINKNEHGAATPLELLATMLGHGAAAVMSHLGKLGFSEAADGTRLGIMRFLGSDRPIKAEGFKSMVNFMNNTYKGESVLSKGVKNVFKRGSEVLGTHLIPDAKDREKIDKIVVKMQNPSELIAKQTEGELGHYLPGHQAAIAQSTTAAIQYLHTLKPQPVQLSPLDRPIEPTPAQEARYNRALDIAQQPAIVLQHIKDGTLLLSDIKDLNSMYPAYFKNMCNQLSNEMINAHANEEPIPYKTKVSISLILGQGMDSSMSPQAIIAAQPKPAAPLPKAQKSKIGNKTNDLYKTSNQTAESDRSARS